MIKLNSKKILLNFSVFILLIVLALVMTFPLFLRIDKTISGFFSTDEPSVWYMWWLKHAKIEKVASYFSYYISYPFGIDLSFVEVVYPVWTGIRKILIISLNGPASYNIEVLSGFVLSGFFVYLAAHHLTKCISAAIFSGIIFAFCPYRFVRAWQHIGLAHTQWMVLLLLTLFLLKDNLDKRNIFWVFTSLYFVSAFEMHYAIFSALIILIFMCYLWFKQRKSHIKLTLWIGFISLINFLIFIILFRAGLNTVQTASMPSAWSMIRPFEDLFTQSAKPLSYFLPAVVHPIFGKFTEQFIGSSLYGMSFTEHTLYLGWVPLVLAFLAFRRWRRDRKTRTTTRLCSGQANHELRITDKEDFYIGFFVFLAVAAWLFSQPPWWDIFGFKIYMPSFFMYKILPMFRAYCRFGIVVMLAVAVLAGFGLKFFLERFKSQRTKVAVTTLFCGLVLFEFWNWPPYKVIDLSKVPAVYYWLKDQPKDIVIADYPLDADSPNELYKFFQTAHEKKIINGTIPGTQANKVAQGIRRLSEPKTASILKWMGVKYVVVHKDDYLKTDLIEDKEDMERIPQNQGLKFVKSFPPQECPDPNLMCVQKTGPVDVYEVVSKSRAPEVKN